MSVRPGIIFRGRTFGGRKGGNPPERRSPVRLRDGLAATGEWRRMTTGDQATRRGAGDPRGSKQGKGANDVEEGVATQRSNSGSVPWSDFVACSARTRRTRCAGLVRQCRAVRRKGVGEFMTKELTLRLQM